jgi:hypothetical protein
MEVDSCSPPCDVYCLDVIGRIFSPDHAFIREMMNLPAPFANGEHPALPPSSRHMQSKKRGCSARSPPHSLAALAHRTRGEQVLHPAAPAALARRTRMPHPLAAPHARRTCIPHPLAAALARRTHSPHPLAAALALRTRMQQHSLAAPASRCRARSQHPNAARARRRARSPHLTYDVVS